MSEDTMRKALAEFERALGQLLPHTNPHVRHAFTEAVFGLVDATLSRVTLIVHQRASGGLSVDARLPIEQAEDDPTGTDAGAHPRG